VRILYIHHTLVPPSPDPGKNRFLLLEFEADILRPIWFGSSEEVEQFYGPGSYPVYTVGRCRYHWLLARRRDGLRRKLSALWFYLSRGLRIYRERRFDCVVTYSHMMTGVCGAVLKLLTGAKLIVEIVTAADRSYLVNQPRPTLGDRFMQRFSNLCLHISLLSCDQAHLLGPGLIAPFKRLRKVPRVVYHSFSPISAVPRRRDVEEQSILLVGAPWYLKGADLLVAAFRRLAGDFPGVKLKIVGYFPDREHLEALTGGLPQIEILKHRPNTEVLEMMSLATIFALPSRCEGMAVVILEAMASGLPVVASDVGGIPTLVRDGENGFLVPVGDIPALEARLRQLLSDKGLRERMGARSYEIAHSEFSEKAYVDQFTRMVTEVVNGRA
jgi:glycosyltransferase involved in cell wall biosynthesis